MADLNEDRKRPSSPARLKGWSEIAQFLGQPVAVAQRWAKSGMPVRREGRFVTALTNELSQYLGREAGLNVPVRIPTGDTDLSTELKRALSHTRAASVRNSKH
jgi:hypothetical protein